MLLLVVEQSSLESRPRGVICIRTPSYTGTVISISHSYNLLRNRHGKLQVCNMYRTPASQLTSKKRTITDVVLSARHRQLSSCFLPFPSATMYDLWTWYALWLLGRVHVYVMIVRIYQVYDTTLDVLCVVGMGTTIWQKTWR